MVLTEERRRKIRNIASGGTSEGASSVLQILDAMPAGVSIADVLAILFSISSAAGAIAMAGGDVDDLRLLLQDTYADCLTREAARQATPARA